MKDTLFQEIYMHVMHLLKTQLPSYLSYHNVEHTLYVLEKSTYIAKKEGVNENDLWLLKIAALYHDIGYTKTNVEHEQVGCEIARKDLKVFGITKNDIDVICRMIMATRIPQQPHTLLEEILADADLEYLGTKHFDKVSELLYLELKHYNNKLTREEWNTIQINFLSKHNYHTDFCKRYKKHRKLQHIEKLKNV